MSLFKSINWYFVFYKKAVVCLSFKRKSRLNLQTRLPIREKATFVIKKATPNTGTSEGLGQRGFLGLEQFYLSSFPVPNFTFPNFT